MAQEEPELQPQLIRAVRQKLESLRDSGVSHLPKAKRVAGGKQAGKAPQAKGAPPVTMAPASTVELPPKIAAQSVTSVTPPEPSPSPPLPVPYVTTTRSREEVLAVVAKRVAACTRCPVLVKNRTQTVFGVGNPHSKLVFLGEAPGADEDRQGEPFVGRAGQLLTDIITKGMKLRREDVYIMNILRCRPPDNRTPLPLEAANCREYLEAQLAIIQPQFICCLGACAAQNLLGVDTAIGKLRSRLIDFNGMKLLCTYHPAYVLRNPPAKRHVWDDIQILMTAMGMT